MILKPKGIKGLDFKVVQPKMKRLKPGRGSSW
jgi:hypothetical protein